MPGVIEATPSSLVTRMSTCVTGVKSLLLLSPRFGPAMLQKLDWYYTAKMGPTVYKPTRWETIRGPSLPQPVSSSPKRFSIGGRFTSYP